MSAAIAKGIDLRMTRYHYPLFIPTATNRTRPYFEAWLSII
ncbi:hypothetical protein [Psychrobacter glacincola]|uniref:Uncharacterized protein n=1 Tax=Psychrobacter glacincola TaxID=56810 RepID=A0ABW1WCH0_9GAMM|nr:hypothetical protein [Psychrobacter glacincola]